MSEVSARLAVPSLRLGPGLSDPPGVQATVNTLETRGDATVVRPASSISPGSCPRPATSSQQVHRYPRILPDIPASPSHPQQAHLALTMPSPPSVSAGMCVQVANMLPEAWWLQHSMFWSLPPMEAVTRPCTQGRLLAGLLASGGCQPPSLCQSPNPASCPMSPGLFCIF